MSTASDAFRSLARAYTMTVINPWAYYEPVSILTDIAKTVTARAAIYLLQTLEADIRRVLGPAMQTNMAVELSQQALQVAETVVASLTISPALTRYFMFRLSPSRLDKTFPKIRDTRVTGAGVVMDTYGNNAVSYSYNGTMGSMRPAFSPSDLPIKMPQLTPAWYYLQLFERFFIQHNQDLLFVLDDEVVIGRFDSFSYSIDANNPWIINYKFQITVYPNTKWGLLDGYIGAAFATIKPDVGAPWLTDPFKDDKPISSKINVFDDTYGKLHARELSTGRLP